MKDEGVNRAMLLTPPGAAAIAVVRIAGPLVGPFLSKHFSRPAKPNRCVHGRLSDGDRVIDDPVIVLHDDRADINLHGGPWVVQECLNLAERAGFQLVESAQDLLDGQDIIEREMIAALPLARTGEGLRMLLAQPALWGSSFSVHPSSLDSETIPHILADRSLWWMLHPPKVAIVGIPNVGKSTLANQLFGTQRSITADLPGTTRDWVGDWANIDGLPIELLDTPGQRATSDPIERAAITRSRVEVGSADLVLLVLDPTQPEHEQATLRSEIQGAMVVINKADLPGTWHCASGEVVRTVATTGHGLDVLRGAIRDRFVSSLEPARCRWWTERQLELLQKHLGTPR